MFADANVQYWYKGGRWPSLRSDRSISILLYTPKHGWRGTTTKFLVAVMCQESAALFRNACTYTSLRSIRMQLLCTCRYVAQQRHSKTMNAPLV